MTGSKNISLQYEQIALGAPDFPALVSSDMTITNAQLWSIVEAFAAKMQEYGVKPGTLIAVNTTDMVVSLASLLATSLIGAEYVVAKPSLASAKVLKPAYFFKTAEVTGSDRVMFFNIDETWGPAQQKRSVERDQHDTEKPWLYLHTSGTTGQPKYFNLTQTLVSDRSTAVAGDFPFQKTRFVSLASCNSRPFFARAIAALLNCCTIVDSFDPEVWQAKGVTLVCASPSQIKAVLNEAEFKNKLSEIEVSGAHLPDDECKLLLSNFERVIDVYGASETNKSFANIKTLDAQGALVTTGHKLDSALEIISENGAQCQADEIGTVRVKNTYTIGGYLNGANTSFRDGWFYPGDLGNWGANGELVLLGRTDDVINLGGLKVNAKLVDTVLRSIDGIEDGICFKNPKPDGRESLIAFIKVGALENHDACVHTAKQLTAEILGVAMAPQTIRVVNEIPVDQQGNPDRKHCENLVLDRTNSRKAKG